jgi:hypothetical protein
MVVSGANINAKNVNVNVKICVRLVWGCKGLGSEVHRFGVQRFEV